MFSRSVSMFLENYSLTREKKEAAPPVSLPTCWWWLYVMLCKCTRMGSRSTHSPGHTPTKKHMPTNLQALQTWSEPIAVVCIHAKTSSCPLHHVGVLQPWGRCPADLVQWVSLNLCLGPYVLAGTRGHDSRQDHNTDPPKLPRCRWYSSTQDQFPPATSCCLHKAVKTHTANFIHKLFLVGKQQLVDKTHTKKAKK